MRISAKQLTNESGFTLIETLVALALMGLVLSALANLTAQWLPNWNRGLDRIQRSEQIGIALQRIADDLAAAQSVPVSRGDKPPPLFAGSEQSVTFVRTALRPERRARARRGASGPRRPIKAGSRRFARERHSGHCHRKRRSPISFISASPWCYCVRRTDCPLPMRPRTVRGKAVGRIPTGYLQRSG